MLPTWSLCRSADLSEPWHFLFICRWKPTSFNDGRPVGLRSHAQLITRFAAWDSLICVNFPGGAHFGRSECTDTGRSYEFLVSIDCLAKHGEKTEVFFRSTWAWLRCFSSPRQVVKPDKKLVDRTTAGAEADIDSSVAQPPLLRFADEAADEPARLQFEDKIA